MLGRREVVVVVCVARWAGGRARAVAAVALPGRCATCTTLHLNLHHTAPACTSTCTCCATAATRLCYCERCTVTLKSHCTVLESTETA